MWVTGSMPAWLSSSIVLRTHIEAIDLEKVREELPLVVHASLPLPRPRQRR